MKKILDRSPGSSLNQPRVSSAIVLSSDDELGPNDRTPPRLSQTGPQRNSPSQPSTSRVQFHDAVNADGPIGDSNPILNPITLERAGPSR